MQMTPSGVPNSSRVSLSPCSHHHHHRHLSLDSVVDPWIEGLWAALETVAVKVDSEPVSDVPIPAAPASAAAAAAAAASPAPASVPAAAGAVFVVRESEPEFEAAVAALQSTPPDTEAPLEPGTHRDAAVTVPVSAFHLVSAPEYADKRVFEVVLNLSDACPALRHHRPGDAIGVLCENDPRLVAALAARLNLDLAQQVCVSGGVHRGVHTVGGLLAAGLELVGAPTKALLRVLASHCGDASEAARLSEAAAATPAGRAAYNALLGRRPSLLDLLVEFPSAQPPLSELLAHVPRLAPRVYSASSAAAADPDHVRIAFCTVRYAVGGGGERAGVCSAWLVRRLAPLLGDRDLALRAIADATLQPALDTDLAITTVPLSLRVFLRPTAEFRLPVDTTVPLVLVATGTGLTPFLAFLQHRVAAQAGGAQLGEAWLYVGCRHARGDFAFGAEIEAAQASGALTGAVFAFSRDQQDKVYVTHRLRERAAEVARLVLRAGAVVYVCGDVKAVVKGVREALLDIVQTQGGLSAGDATAYLQTMTKEKRYLLDIWG
jgi:sulfite reductase alpha subunit-like flavoprotein